MQVLSEAHQESERQAFDYFIKVAIFDTEQVYYKKMKVFFVVDIIIDYNKKRIVYQEL